MRRRVDGAGGVWYNSDMEKLGKFDIDHKKLKAGLYVESRVAAGEYDVVTVFDVRLKRPYVDEPMTPQSTHTIEHLAESFLRSDELWGKKIIYFGCRGSLTGFSLIVAGALDVQDILPLVIRTFDFVAEYEGEIPGAKERECSACSEHDLEEAKNDAAMYYNLLIAARKTNFNYPEKKAK